MNYIIKEFKERYPNLSKHSNDVETVANLIKKLYYSKNKILLCGNGGSGADCEHIVGELVKKFKINRPLENSLKEKLEIQGHKELADKLCEGINAQSLISQSAFFTAICNDVGFDYAYAQQVAVYGNKGDVLFALSTSGNSISICNAVHVAKAKDMTVVGFTGENGGELKPLCDICFNVSEKETFKIQELHLPVYHTICALSEYLIWGNK